MSTITRKRGDNYPIQAFISVNGEPIDLSTSTMKFSFKLSDGSGSVTTVDGTVDLTQTGLVRFYPTVEQMSVAGQYLYDIQRDEAGIISTHLSGTLLLQGDVTPNA